MRPRYNSFHWSVKSSQETNFENPETQKPMEQEKKNVEKVVRRDGLVEVVGR